MPCKQNRYLILTKPRPHKRIFSDSRWFCNESPSPPLSPPFRPPPQPFRFPPRCFLNDLLFVFVSGVCDVVAGPPSRCEPRGKQRKSRLFGLL